MKSVLFQLRVVVEIVWPLCLFLILVAVRTRPDLKENKPECKRCFYLFILFYFLPEAMKWWLIMVVRFVSRFVLGCKFDFVILCFLVGAGVGVGCLGLFFECVCVCVCVCMWAYDFRIKKCLAHVFFSSVWGHHRVLPYIIILNIPNIPF